MASKRFARVKMHVKDGIKPLVSITGHVKQLDAFDIEQLAILEQDLELVTGLRFHFDLVQVIPDPKEPPLPLEG